MNTDLIDNKDVLAVFDDHRSGAREHGKFLWSVYVFARWHNRMVDSGVLTPSS